MEERIDMSPDRPLKISSESECVRVGLTHAIWDAHGGLTAAASGPTGRHRESLLKRGFMSGHDSPSFAPGGPQLPLNWYGICTSARAFREIAMSMELRRTLWSSKS